LFKKVVGVSPHQYILSKRLELGKELLEKKQMPVSAAALESGFADVFSFSKAFRKHFGVSPTHFSKNSRI
jgi:AraC-like DNA-binding protein